MTNESNGALADGPHANAKPIDIAMLTDALGRARLQVSSQRQTRASAETLRIIDAALRDAGRMAGGKHDDANPLADALHELWKLIEGGALVRNVAYDHEAGYALKAMALVMALKHADAALRAAGRLP